MSPFPRVLTLHPTTFCTLNCYPCYLKRLRKNGKERDLAFFAALIDSAANSGIKEAAISVNRVTGKLHYINIGFLELLSQKAKRTDLKLSVTTNYENIIDFGARLFSHCHLVSLSYDEYKIGNCECPRDLKKAIALLKKHVETVNINFLLTKALMERLASGLIEEILAYSDTAYLIIPKLAPLDVTISDLLDFLNQLTPFFDNFETFKRVYLDNCLKPIVYPFSEIHPYCERGVNIVSVNSYGEVSFCEFDEPFAKLQDAEDFEGVVRKHYQMHPQEKTFACPYIQFHRQGI